MIILKRAGKAYEIDAEDQRRIAELIALHRGDIDAALRQHWREKYGEEMPVGRVDGEPQADSSGE